MRSAGFWPDRLLIGYKGNNGPVIMAQDKRKSRNGQHWGRQMTTAEKEKRIFDLGKPWTEIMKGLEVHRSITEEEKKSDHKDSIARAREDYYSNALSVVLECGQRRENSTRSGLL